jgi:hypothetical protein
MRKQRLLALLIALALGILPGIAGALVADGYTLTWWTVDGGGGTSSAPAYVLQSTTGQPDASPALIGDGYQLVGGFWSEVGIPPLPGGPEIYLPVVLR